MAPKAKPKPRGRPKARKPPPKAKRRVRSGSSSKISSAHSSETSSALLSSGSASKGSTNSVPQGEPRSRSYERIKGGVKKSVPVAVVLWAFHKLPAEKGLTSYRIITFLKGRFKFAGRNNKKIGQSIGHMLRTAVEFGILEKKGRRFFLSPNYKRNSQP